MQIINQQVLELILASLASKTQKMLHEQLPGGVHTDMNEEQMPESKSVPLTSVTVERDFGLLDFMVRERPHAYMGTIESV